MSKSNNQSITISSSFLRSVNLASDFGRADSLDNYILQNSTQRLVNVLNNHISTSKQRAFTITGPYGGGKSSLALLLASLVSKDQTLKKKAQGLLKGTDDLKSVWKSDKGWLVLPIVGKNEAVEKSIGDSIKKNTRKKIEGSNQNLIIAELIRQAEDRPKDGVLLVIDELGKFLEHASKNEGDVYFYQLLAEAASRCKGKIIILGILHQSFEEYANKLGKSTQEEWAKIQGRWVDLPLVSTTDEGVELIGKAIQTKDIPKTQKKVDKIFNVVAKSVQKRRPNLSTNYANSLKSCWPLNPIVSTLVGPISRKKFSQNERTIFSFLTSAEPFGFNEFIHSKNIELLYGPETYWDYLKANFEQSIMQSSDGHRWAVANEAIERTEERNGCTELHIKIIKTIALLDLFKTNSGLYPEDKVLETTLSKTSKSIKEIISDLARWSIIIYKKHLNSWAIYSGSDFDIDKSINETRLNAGALDKNYISTLVDLNVVVAKRHYHQNGALRWFTKNLSNLTDLHTYLEDFSPKDGAIGEFILVIPDTDKNKKENNNTLEKIIKKYKMPSAVIGFMKNIDKLNDLGSELIALEGVQKNYRELEGDVVARREIESRVSSIKIELKSELSRSFDEADWHNILLNKISPNKKLTLIASQLADEIYNKAPKIFNEIINKDFGSSTASLGRKLLMYKMLESQGMKDLGFSSSSLEASLFQTVLKTNNLYINNNGTYEFVNPKNDNHFFNLWKATDNLFDKENKQVGLEEIYSLWGKPPFGLKAHVYPIIALAYLFSKKFELIIYREGKFIPDLSEVTIDEWIMDPSAISFKAFRWTDDKKQLIKLLSKEINKEFNLKVEETSLAAARSVVQLVVEEPPTSRRTFKLSESAIKFRDIVQRANDPNKVLFTDLPELFNEKDPKKLIAIIIKNIKEIKKDYPTMLKKYKGKLFERIDHQGNVKKLNERAKKILNLGSFSDNSFIKRLEIYDEKKESTEGLLSIAINKQPSEWTDIDREEALTNIGLMCDKFRKIEVMASMRDEDPSREAFAFVFLGQKKEHHSRSYNISNINKDKIKKSSKKLIATLQKEGLNQDEIMAILAEACNENIELDEDING